MISVWFIPVLVAPFIGALIVLIIVYERRLRRLRTEAGERDLVALVRRYAMEIKNGRTPQDIYDHYLSEHEELRQDWDGVAGEDGVIGESIDIITCLLDLIIVSAPTVTDAEIHAVALRKLEKWKRHYSHSIHRDRSAAA